MENIFYIILILLKKLQAAACADWSIKKYAFGK